MERLVASQDRVGQTRATSFSLPRFDMERRGRTKSFVTTGLVTFALFWLQTLPWLVSTGGLQSRTELDPMTSPRLSLLFDFLFLMSLVFHGVRAGELVSMGARRMPPEARTGRRKGIRKIIQLMLRIGLAILLLGVALDAVENVWLWAFAGADDARNLFVPVLTPVVWAVLGLGVVWLWGMAAWLWWEVDRPVRQRTADRASEAMAAAVPPDDAAPAPLDGTIITCSGGGMRSTSFCLGGLQVLTDAGIYQQARSVVGVSGGGYIAAAMHIVRSRKDFESLTPPAFADASPEEAWLRRNTRFLLESARVAALGGLSLLYGMVVNLFLVASVLLFAGWWLGWFYAASGGLTDWNVATASAADYHDGWTSVTWTAWLSPAGLATFMVADAADRLFQLPRLLRKGARELSVLLLALGIVAVAVFFAVPWLLVLAHNYAAGSGSALARLVTAAGLIPQDLCDRLVSTGEACGSAGGPSVSGASFVSLGAIVAAMATVLRSARRFLPDAAGVREDAGSLRKLLDRVAVRLLPWAALLVIALAVLTLLLRWTTALVADPTLLGHWRWFYLVGVGFAVLRVSTDANRTSLHYFYRERLSKAFVLERTSTGIRPVDYAVQLRFSEARPPEGDGPELVACASANVSDNEVVPADRNCVPYSFGHQTIGLSGELFPPEARTSSRLFELNADRSYRVATIPAAMAMSGAAFSPLAGRYTRRLAPYRVVMALANARLGVWLPNPLWIEDGRVFRRAVKLRLRTEVEKYLADAGAAVSTADLRLDRLNARDLVWLRSLELDAEARWAVDEELSGAGPSLPDEASAEGVRAKDIGYMWIRQVFFRPGAFYLAKEAFGKTSVYDRFLYITDGGHYDNLGLVEALRHRPQTVYVLDASSDPSDSFSTLGQAIATARMDLGCEVELDPRPLRTKKNKPPLACYGRGKVRYADGAETDLYFVKAIVTRTLPWDVEAYAKEHGTFPRTATSNQLYGEFDLEAYRILGREGARALLRDIAREAAGGPGPSSSAPATPAPPPDGGGGGQLTADELPVGEAG
jgi:hypothetical protein